MIGRETIGHLDLALKAIMQNQLPFAEISQLKGVFTKTNEGSYRSFDGRLWEKY